MESMEHDAWLVHSDGELRLGLPVTIPFAIAGGLNQGARLVHRYYELGLGEGRPCAHLVRYFREPRPGAR